MNIKLRTVSTWIGFMLLGVALTILVLALCIRKQPSAEETKRQLALDYTAQAQKAMGMECSRVKASLVNLLRTKIEPIIHSRREGELWYALVSPELKDDLNRHNQFVSNCARLYMIGEGGKLNDLKDMSYIEKAHEEYGGMSALLLYAERSEELCSKKCLDAKFKILAESYSRLIHLLDVKLSIKSNILFDTDAQGRRST